MHRLPTRRLLAVVCLVVPVAFFTCEAFPTPPAASAPALLASAAAKA